MIKVYYEFKQSRKSRDYSTFQLDVFKTILYICVSICLQSKLNQLRNALLLQGQTADSDVYPNGEFSHQFITTKKNYMIMLKDKHYASFGNDATVSSKFIHEVLEVYEQHDANWKRWDVYSRVQLLSSNELQLSPYLQVDDTVRVKDYNCYTKDPEDESYEERVFYRFIKEEIVGNYNNSNEAIEHYISHEIRYYENRSENMGIGRSFNENSASIPIALCMFRCKQYDRFFGKCAHLDVWCTSPSFYETYSAYKKKSAKIPIPAQYGMLSLYYALVKLYNMGYTRIVVEYMLNDKQSLESKDQESYDYTKKLDNIYTSLGFRQVGVYVTLEVKFATEESDEDSENREESDENLENKDESSSSESSSDENKVPVQSQYARRSSDRINSHINNKPEDDSHDSSEEEEEEEEEDKSKDNESDEEIEQERMTDSFRIISRSIQSVSVLDLTEEYIQQRCLPLIISGELEDVNIDSFFRVKS